MFACTGIRKAELVAMTFADIDFATKTATVRAANAKTHKAREIPLDDVMLAMLELLRDEAKHRQPVAGNSPAETAAQLANFSREHVFVTKANTPHRNNLLKRFYAIQAILGHSTLAMTLAAYAKATERSKREAIGALPFAAVTPPQHLIPVQYGHAVATTNPSAPQLLTLQESA
jgi:integrase